MCACVRACAYVSNSGRAEALADEYDFSSESRRFLNDGKFKMLLSATLRKFHNYVINVTL